MSFLSILHMEKWNRYLLMIVSIIIMSYPPVTIVIGSAIPSELFISSPGKTFQRHTFWWSTAPVSVIKCMFLCARERECLSFNLAEDLPDGAINCFLNNATAVSHPEDFYPDPTFTYYETRSRLRPKVLWRLSFNNFH